MKPNELLATSVDSRFRVSGFHCVQLFLNVHCYHHHEDKMLRPNDQPHDEHPIIIKECDDNTSQPEQIDIIPFGFVSSDEPPSLHGSLPITPARSALLLHDSFSRSSNSPFKIPIVNCGSTPAQLHELKQKSRPLPDYSEIGSRPGFSATPGPKQHGNGYGLFDSNSKENDIIYSSIKNSERNHPSSPDTRDIPHFKFMLNFMDSPEPAPFIATRVDDGDKDRNGEDDETYHRGKVLFTDDPLSSRPDTSSRIVDPISSDVQMWQPSPSNVWQRDKDSINLQEPVFLPNRKITQPSNIVESFVRTSEFIGTDSNIFLPMSSAEVIIDGRNSNLNRNKWNRNRNSHDRTGIGSSLDSDVSLSLRKMGISVDTVRISNDSSKNANKQDFMESPRSKNAIKEFNNKFRFFAKSSFAEAEDFANKEVLLMPDHAKWRVFVELAELAKKNNDADKVSRGSVNWFIFLIN
jgi:hypothetical protein